MVTNSFPGKWSGILLFALILRCPATAQKLWVKELPFKKEHEGVNINKIYQDSSGLLWLGTTDGLFRYDGNSFTRYLLSESGGNVVTSIYQDRKQHLWVGYQSGSIAILADQHLQWLNQKDSLRVAPVTDILEDKDGIIWISTYGEGIFYRKNGEFVNINLEDGLTDNFIYVMVEDKKGRKWAGTDRGIGICHLENGIPKIRTINVEDGLKDNIVKAITSDRDGDLFIGLYENGFCKYDLEREAIINTDYPSWSYGPINHVEVIKKNEIWLATEREGVFAYNFDNGGLYRVIESNEFKNAKVLSLLKDRQGGIWFSDNFSTLKMTDPRFEFHVDFNRSLQEINSFATDKQGNIWYAGDMGINKYDPNKPGNKVTHFRIPQLPDPGKVISTYLDDYGFLWLGTYEHGVFRFDPITGILTNLNESHGLVNNNVLSINGYQSDIWFATLGGVSRCRLTNPRNPADFSFKFQNFNEEDGLGTIYIYQVFIDSRGRAWFATHGKGITVFDNETIEHFGAIDDLSSNVIYSVAEDAHGNMWFSTANGELYQYNNDKFEDHTRAIGPKKKSILSLIGDRYGNLIIVFADGMGLLDNKSTYHDLKSSLGNSITDNPLNAVDLDVHGNIWISTQKGLIKFDQYKNPDEIGHTTFIEHVAIFFEKVEVNPGERFLYDQNHLTFYCRSALYRHLEEISYEYMLEGFDLDWNVSKDYHFTYPKLPPGDYSFKVKTRLSSQPYESNLARFDFTIVAPLWQRPWFYLSVICGLAIGLFYYIKAREKRLKQSERMQKDIIEFQFQTLKSQVNPHFLFNSFNTLIAIIEENQELAVDYVSKLSDFFRHVLTYRDKQIITLKEELKLMNDYFFLQQKRYGNNFSIEANVSEKAKKTFIPPLTLQLLTENALKHNVVSKKKNLTIEIFDRGEELYVKNNLNPKNPDSGSTGFGLENIKNRYLLLSNKQIEVYRSDSYFSVIVPLLTKIA